MALLGGVVCTLISSWVVPLGLLHFGVIEHAAGSSQTWIPPERQSESVWYSELQVADWWIVRPTREHGGQVPDHLLAVLPRWVARPGEFGPPASETLYEVHTEAMGWPLRAMKVERWAGFVMRPDGKGVSRYTEHVRGGAELGKGLRGRIMLPLRPIWWGLVGDVVIYAVVCAWVRSMWRRVRGVVCARKGKCARCGYDLRGTPAGKPCSECGAARG